MNESGLHRDFALKLGLVHQVLANFLLILDNIFQSVLKELVIGWFPESPNAGRLAV
jgi:hypothetical protein